MWNAPCVTHASARPFPAPSTQTPEGVACPRDHRPQNPPPGTFPQGPRPRDHPGAWFPPRRGWEHTGAEKPPAQGRHRCEVTRKEATPRTRTRLARITAHKDKFQGCSILEEKNSGQRPGRSPAEAPRGRAHHPAEEMRSSAHSPPAPLCGTDHGQTLGRAPAGVVGRAHASRSAARPSAAGPGPR